MLIYERVRFELAEQPKPQPPQPESNVIPISPVQSLVPYKSKIPVAPLIAVCFVAKLMYLTKLRKTKEDTFTGIHGGL
jgi:hypothetical protein